MASDPALYPPVGTYGGHSSQSYGKEAGWMTSITEERLVKLVLYAARRSALVGLWERSNIRCQHRLICPASAKRWLEIGGSTSREDCVRNGVSTRAQDDVSTLARTYFDLLVFSGVVYWTLVVLIQQ